MAVVHYHIHRARPKNFAVPTDVIRLILLPAEVGFTGVWLFRRACWSPGRFSENDHPGASAIRALSGR